MSLWSGAPVHTLRGAVRWVILPPGMQEYVATSRVSASFEGNCLVMGATGRRTLQSVGTRRTAPPDRVECLRHRPKGPGEEGLLINLWRKLVLFGAVAATVSMVDAAVANAGDYIDYGTNQSACMSAAKQANATGNRGSFCYQTGPGHYTLYVGK